MKIRKLRTITYITILTAPLDKQIYIGKSFEAILNNEAIVEFKDWLSGNPSDGYIKSVVGFTYSFGKGFDIDLFDDSFALDPVEIVRNNLYQRLLINFGELRYSYIDTTNVGIPYVSKKTKAEMDLILKREILSTEGVDKITEFNSKLENRVYKLDFKVKIIGGETIWLTIEQ